MPEQQKNAINRQIQDHIEEFKSNFHPEVDNFYQIVNGVIIHTTCSGREEDMKHERYLCELSKAERRIFRRRMKKLAEPKRSEPIKGPVRLSFSRVSLQNCDNGFLLLDVKITGAGSKEEN